VGPLCATPASFMWECPILAHLTTAPPSNGGGSPPRQRHMLAVAPDYCVNMIGASALTQWLGRQGLTQRRSTPASLTHTHTPPWTLVTRAVYWLGDYAAGRFDLGGACGPHPLDLGDAAYAPNVLTDKQVGRAGGV
jgi:sucrose-6-phosphate hydrolase SacC (GH32 family)